MAPQPKPDASIDKRKERSCCKRNGMGCVKESTKDQNATSTSGGRGEGRLEATATKREKGGSREEEPHVKKHGGRNGRVKESAI